MIALGADAERVDFGEVEDSAELLGTNLRFQRSPNGDTYPVPADSAVADVSRDSGAYFHCGVASGGGALLFHFPSPCLCLYRDAANAG
jgi:hypothetical protein